MSINRKLDALEKTFGKGPTYDLHTQHLILDGVVPEWIFRGQKLLTGEVRDRCAKAVKALEELHRGVTAALPPAARKESDDGH